MHSQAALHGPGHVCRAAVACGLRQQLVYRCVGALLWHGVLLQGYCGCAVLLDRAAT
jgi:hypothetical protein